MEHKKTESRMGSFSRGAAVALASALVCLTICTFMLCNTLVEQLLPVILFVVFAPIAFVSQRTRWSKAHVWLLAVLGTALAIGCGFVIRLLF